MSNDGPRSIQIEWFNVTYRSVVLLVTTAVALGVLGISYWYYSRIYVPRTGAVTALQKAETRYSEAVTLRGDERVAEILESAGGSLNEARRAMAGRLFGDANMAAIRSENLSNQAINLVKGDEAGSKMVRFYRIEGDVRVKRVGQFSWETADAKMKLRSGDQVKTSSSASAQLIYFDGTMTTIQPGSLLEIRELFENPVTKVRRVREQLNWGELKASTQHRNVEGSYHEVATDKASAKTEEAGEFRVAYDQRDKTTTFDVFEGRIEVATADRRESIVAGERVRSSANGQMQAKEALPGIPRLVTPRDERVFIFDDPASNSVTLSWERVTGASRYHLVISDKALFTTRLYDAKRDETTAVMEGVPEGSYHWKVAAVGPATASGPFSSARRFRVTSQKIRDRADKVSPELEITEFVTIGMMVIVNGRTEPGATLWVGDEKIDVYDDGKFYLVVRLRKEGLNELRFVAQDAAGNETAVVKAAYLEVF